MQLSKRLLAVASMVTRGRSLADVGTDHGYVPIYLVEQRIIRHAIAMDINQGPLERAKEHIRLYGLEEYIDIRLSDGLRKLLPGEADSVVIAGMGGGLMQRILEDGAHVLASVSELILEPQSETEALRRWILANGYAIVSEDMVLEDGKFYPVFRAVPGEMFYEKEEYYRYGRELLLKKNQVLYKYLLWKREMAVRIMETLEPQNGEKSRMRLNEIKQEMQSIETALSYYEV